MIGFADVVVKVRETFDVHQKESNLCSFPSLKHSKKADVDQQEGV